MFEYRMSRKKFIWWIASASAINSSNTKKTIRFWSVWSQATKNGLFTIMSAEKEVGVGEVKHRKGKQRRRSTKRKKIMLSIWWDWKESVFYELLPKNKTINSDVYCEQLQKLSDAIAQKCPELINRKGVMFYYDNARPHTSLITRQKLLQHGWNVLPHPCIVQTLHHQTSISFAPCKTFWMIKRLLLKILSN